MSTTDGDASSRLSNALEEILSAGETPTPSAGDDEASADAALPGTEVVPGPAEPAPAAEVPESSAPVTPAAGPTEEVPRSPAPSAPPDLAAEPPTGGSAASTAPPSEFTADWSVDDDDDQGAGPAGNEVYELPEIVPATNPLPLPGEPQLAPTARTAPAAPTPVPAVVPTPASPTSTAPASTAPATSWGDHMAPASTGAAGTAGAPLRAPGRRPRVRRVTRVLRHIDPWSTFKVALLFSAVAYVVMLTAGVLLWRVADDTGTLANVERWFTQFGWETFELKGGEIFHNAWIIGLFGVVAMTGALVLTATLFNLVSDIVGGVRLTVLEEEVVERTVSSTRRYVVRRTPAAEGAAAAATQDWDVDADDPVAETDASATAWTIEDDDDVDGDGDGDERSNDDGPPAGG